MVTPDGGMQNYVHGKRGQSKTGPVHNEHQRAQFLKFGLLNEHVPPGEPVADVQDQPGQNGSHFAHSEVDLDSTEALTEPHDGLSHADEDEARDAASDDQEHQNSRMPHMDVHDQRQIQFAFAKMNRVLPPTKRQQHGIGSQINGHVQNTTDVRTPTSYPPSSHSSSFKGDVPAVDPMVQPPAILFQTPGPPRARGEATTNGSQHQPRLGEMQSATAGAGPQATKKHVSTDRMTAEAFASAQMQAQQNAPTVANKSYHPRRSAPPNQDKSHRIVQPNDHGAVPTMNATTSEDSHAARLRDYLGREPQELFKTSWKDLKTEPYDLDAPSCGHEGPSLSGEALHQALASHLGARREGDEQQQREQMSREEQDQLLFFASLTGEQWDEAGEWFMQKLQDIIGRLTTVRREKRKIGFEFEREIETRYAQVEKKRKVTQDALDDMKSQGTKVLPCAVRKA